MSASNSQSFLTTKRRSQLSSTPQTNLQRTHTIRDSPPKSRGRLRHEHNVPVRNTKTTLCPSFTSRRWFAPQAKPCRYDLSAFSSSSLERLPILQGSYRMHLSVHPERFEEPRALRSLRLRHIPPSTMIPMERCSRTKHSNYWMTQGNRSAHETE
jgi:hypothetical protein